MSDTTTGNTRQISTSSNTRKIWSWAMFDFANSSYTTVVTTTLFNAYFVDVIAGKESGLVKGESTLLLTITIAIANLLIVLSAPIIGAIADYSNIKKKLLVIFGCSCALFTALLSLTGPGTITIAVIFLICATFAYGTGENLIAAFLPDISTRETMGKVSAFGWMLGYLGGIFSLGICLLYTWWAQLHGKHQIEIIPHAMLLTAALYLIAATPAFLWLKEQSQSATPQLGKSYIYVGFKQLSNTLKQIKHFRDLFVFLLTLLLYSCGSATVVYLASVYAQHVMGFRTNELLIMILTVNLTAALGAFVFGFIQDKIGSTPTLKIALALWVLAVTVAAFAPNKVVFWVAANLMGISMGATQSTGRALIGLFCPKNKSGEFFGLWGLVSKLAAIIGPLSYGLTNYFSGGNHHISVLSTALFFVAGFISLNLVNEQRGKQAAISCTTSDTTCQA